MNLYTRCSHCDTVFRVTTRDLQASGGRVRCGHCQTVFDAFATLTAQDPGGEMAAPALRDAQQASEGRLQTERNPPPAESPEQPVRLPGDSETTLPAGGASARSLREDDPAASLYEWEFRLPPAKPRTALWTGLTLLMLLLGGVQAAAGFRTEIMTAYPQTRAVYERACIRLGCEVGLPRLADRIHIEASDLQFIDPARPGEIELSVLLRNRAPVAVEYPAFELTLTSAQEQVVARRVFRPREYLDDPERIARGLAAGADLSIRLSLDTGNVRAVGYRLYLFYL